MGNWANGGKRCQLNIGFHQGTPGILLRGGGHFRSGCVFESGSKASLNEIRLHV